MCAPVPERRNIRLHNGRMHDTQCGRSTCSPFEQSSRKRVIFERLRWIFCNFIPIYRFVDSFSYLLCDVFGYCLRKP